MDQTNGDRLLKIGEAAEYAGASPSWARKLINQGLIPFIDLSTDPNPRRRELRIKLSDLLTFLKSRERAATPAQDAVHRLDEPGVVRARAPRRSAMRA